LPRLPNATTALPAVIVALVCAGCGSSNTSSTTGATNAAAGAVTKAQFIAHAESICAKLNSQEKPLRTRQEALKGLPVDVADTDFVALVHQLVAFSKTAASQLALLPQPAQDKQAIAKLLAIFAAETTEATDIASAASRQESSTGEADEQALRKSIANNRALAAQYGMKDCIGAE
jgi:hypothetical protein